MTAFQQSLEHSIQSQSSSKMALSQGFSCMPDTASIKSDSSSSTSESSSSSYSNTCPSCSAADRDAAGQDNMSSIQYCPVTSPLSSSSSSSPFMERSYTMCQVRRHNHADSAWIVADGVIYDVTQYLSRHPGGADCILRKAGGVKDCAEDLQFHSKRGRKTWEQYRVGTIRKCGGDVEEANAAADVTEKQWWNFWQR